MALSDHNRLYPTLIRLRRFVRRLPRALTLSDPNRLYPSLILPCHFAAINIR